MPSIAYIQLASNGDLVSLLPICKAKADAGYKVYIVTRPEFATILEAVSYVTPVPTDVSDANPYEAEKQAKAMGFDEVVLCQNYKNERRARYGAPNWQLMQWERCGMVEHFHELPTVFDQQVSAKIFLDAVRRNASGRTPILAYNLRGKSSPFIHQVNRDLFQNWIEASFPGWQKVNLGELKLDKPQHLLPLIEVADVLISVDTLTLHLAHATQTPTIALTPYLAFARSEPRNHWIHAATYGGCITDAGLAEIKRMIDERDFELGRLVRPINRIPHVWHAAEIIWYPNNFAWQDEEEKKRFNEVYATWNHQANDRYFRSVLTEHGPDEPVTVEQVIDKAAELAEPQDVIIWTGRWTKLPKDALSRARENAAKFTTDDNEGVVSFLVSNWRKHRQAILRNVFLGSEVDDLELAAR